MAKVWLMWALRGLGLLAVGGAAGGALLGLHPAAGGEVMSALEIVAWGVLAVLCMAMVVVIAAVSALLWCAWRGERIEAAMAEHVDQALDVARAEPWTGGPGSLAIVAGPDLAPAGDPTVAGAHQLYAAYRRGEDLGGPRELSALTDWTPGGWVPIRDWRLSRTDKGWS